MFNFIKDRLQSIKEQKNLAYGPLFIKEYPEGFQYHRPESSLNNAYNVVENIKDTIYKNVNTDTSPTTMQICTNIKGIVEAIKWCKKNTEDGEDPFESFKSFSSIMARIEIDKTQIDDQTSLEAAKALADVLQITRRSIPKLIPGSGLDLTGTKDAINQQRNGLALKIQQYEQTLNEKLQTDSSHDGSTSGESDSSQSSYRHS